MPKTTQTNAATNCASGRRQADDVLLEHIAAGDMTAFETLYRRYVDRLRAFLSRVTQRADIVEEVVNDVFMVVWQSAARFGGKSKVSTWIMGIAYRVALKALRQRRADLLAVPLHPGHLRDTRVPEREAHWRDISLRLHEALQTLTRDHRRVIELAYFAELSYAEIAAVIDRPVNTVKTRVFHARRRLQRALPEFATDMAAQLDP